MRLHGVAVATKGGSVVAELAGGQADAENGIPCTARSRFQLASVSKQFAATAAMLLVESGHLDLGEPVSRWLADAPPQWRQVTLHHLLSHTAGVPHWREAPGLDPGIPATIDQRMESLQAAPLLTEPGAEWHYSSPGYLLVGLIVERAGGRPYAEFLAEMILSPLGLAETSVGARPSTAALGHDAGSPVIPFDLTAMPGTGDLWSSASDLTRFTSALHTGKLLKASSLDEMCTVHACLDDKDEGDPPLVTDGYGYGMYTGLFGGRRAFYHPGDNPGYQSFACWLPEEGASIAILVNDEATDVTCLLRQLVALLLDG